MKDKHEDDAAIGASLETLARHILETPRNELASLRAAFDRQISSIEARLEPSTHQPAIDAAVKIITEVIGQRVDRAQQRTEADMTKALALNTMLRKALDNAQQQVESAQADLAAVQADRNAMVAQHRELTAERLELLRKLKDVTAAKAVAETQYQELVAASQKLTDGLSRTLQGQRQQPPPIAAPPPARSESAEDKAAAKVPRVSAAPAKSAPPAIPPAATPVNARKKPLQFSGPARDANRVKIRRGTHVTVDGIPGELVDLSVGGAQAIVGQMVKPNHLVRLVLPIAAGQLICKGRIVWVLYEQPGTSLSVYRFGVKFTDVEAKAVEDFMQDFREESLAHVQRSSGIA